MSWLSDLWSGDDKSSAPKWYTDQAKNIVNRGNQAANLYPPIYAGAVMANPSGQTQAGWNQADQFARAAGMATGLPPGVSPSMSFNQRMDPYKVEGGYSSNPLLKAGMGATSEAYPGIYDSLYAMYPHLAPEGYRPQSALPTVGQPGGGPGGAGGVGGAADGGQGGGPGGTVGDGTEGPNSVDSGDSMTGEEAMSTISNAAAELGLPDVNMSDAVAAVAAGVASAVFGPILGPVITYAVKKAHSYLTSTERSDGITAVGDNEMDEAISNSIAMGQMDESAFSDVDNPGNNDGPSVGSPGAAGTGDTSAGQGTGPDGGVGY